jgi:hypothetical protein
MTGDVGEIFYMDIHDCCTLLTESTPAPRKPVKLAKTNWDRLNQDDD